MLVQFREKDMPFHFHVEGIGEIRCDTVDELREAAHAFAGKISNVSVAEQPSNNHRKRRKGGVSPGIGPKKSWALAEFYWAMTGTPKADARVELGKLRQEDNKAHRSLEQRYTEFVKWVGQKFDIDPQKVSAQVRALYKSDPDAYKQLVQEFEKRKK